MTHTKILWMSSGVRWGSTCQKISTGMNTSEDLTTPHTANFYRGFLLQETSFLCRKGNKRVFPGNTHQYQTVKQKKRAAENAVLFVIIFSSFYFCVRRTPTSDNSLLPKPFCIISPFAPSLRGDCLHYIP